MCKLWKLLKFPHLIGRHLAGFLKYLGECLDSLAQLPLHLQRFDLVDEPVAVMVEATHMQKRRQQKLF